MFPSWFSTTVQDVHFSIEHLVRTEAIKVLERALLELKCEDETEDEAPF